MIYWESETPIAITTTRNVIQYYPRAQRLSIFRGSFADSEGHIRPGKVVSLDLLALLQSNAEDLGAARSIFVDIVDSIDRRLESLSDAPNALQCVPDTGARTAT